MNHPQTEKLIDAISRIADALEIMAEKQPEPQEVDWEELFSAFYTTPHPLPKTR